MPVAEFNPRKTAMNLERKIQRAYINAMLKIQRSLSIQDIVNMLEGYGLVHRGQILKQDEEEAVQKYIGVLSAAMSEFTQEVFQYGQESMGDIIEFLNDIQEKFTRTTEFNIDFQSVNLWTDRQNRINRMQFIVDEFLELNAMPKDVTMTMQHIKDTMFQFSNRVFGDEFTGANPNVLARRFKQGIGLTRNQLDWVENLRGELLNEEFAKAKSRRLTRRSHQRRMIDGLETMTQTQNIPQTTPALRRWAQNYNDKVDTIVGKYYNAFVRYRAETIARTESLRAVHAGVEDARTAAIMEGAFTRDQFKETWDTSKDSRVRDSHQAMNGQVKGSIVANKFVSGAGVELNYPCDPAAPPQESINCRCVSVLTVDYGKMEIGDFI